MKLILSHPTGNLFSRELAYHSLQRRVLAAFFTSFATFEGSFFDKIAGIGSLGDLRRRRHRVELKPFVRQSPWMEAGRVISSKLGLNSLFRHETGLFSVDSVYRHADLSVAKRIARTELDGADAVYAYEDGALGTFSAARQKGLKCIYDLPIAYWKVGHELMRQESARLPEWAITLGGGKTDSKEKRERKDEELSLADMVVVPSDFVARSLPESCREKTVVIAPFGSPDCSYDPASRKSAKTDRPLRVLFAGSMGQRKGLGDLFEAVKLLGSKDVELVVMGSLLAPMEFYRDQYASFTYEPGRAHNEVLHLMRSCDVLCLPSIVEGRALVMQEAMSQGLPIIITSHTGGVDLVVDGQTGFLVPIRSPEAIAEKLTWFLMNREAIPYMGQKARARAAEYTWRAYGETIIDAISRIV